MPWPAAIARPRRSGERKPAAEAPAVCLRGPSRKRTSQCGYLRSRPTLMTCGRRRRSVSSRRSVTIASTPLIRSISTQRQRCGGAAARAADTGSKMRSPGGTTEMKGRGSYSAVAYELICFSQLAETGAPRISLEFPEQSRLSNLLCAPCPLAAAEVPVPPVEGTAFAAAVPPQSRNSRA